ncbi:MAG TPA: flagellar hook-associated protein FlgK [Deltaproteobacteria bacterium]|nr:flagellar hook-associated protein FlgK [Deltaproteobacteria bacterium]
MSGISALNIAKDSLISHQTAINTTGSNIANVNTTGYTRQRPVFTTNGTMDVAAGLVQMSVSIDQIERVYNRFLEAEINEQIQDFGYSETRKEQLQLIEIIFNETTGEGIDDLFNKFWGALEDLSSNPEGQPERVALLSAAESLTYLFRSFSSDLVAVQDDANAAISDLVTQVNGKLASIADLNEKIAQNETGTGDTNVLRDARTVLAKELAECIDIQYFEDSRGALNIFISNGLTLVESGNYYTLDVQANAGNSFYYDVVFTDNPGVSINKYITSGRLAGFMEIRDTTAAAYLNDLNMLAATLVQEVNVQHRLGYDLMSNVGGDFFDPSKTDARTIAVSAAIIGDINKIAASETVNGDGTNAMYVGRLKDALVLNGNTSTFNGYYSSFIGGIGEDVASANRICNHHTDLMNQLNIKRESISGVSVDEEMLNLIKYQTGYSAAAKLCSTVQELVDTLLGLV